MDKTPDYDFYMMEWISGEGPKYTQMGSGSIKDFFALGCNFEFSYFRQDKSLVGGYFVFANGDCFICSPSGIEPNI